MSALEQELKQLLVEALVLQDVTPDAIDVEAPLFGAGLGLDSVDALELEMAIHKKYGVRISASDEHSRRIFACVRSLAQHIDTARGAHA
jgi:acyl carrier protein